MSQIAVGSHPGPVATFEHGLESAGRFLVPLGRALFASLFIFASLGHFSAGTIGYAASQGVPLAHVLVPASGLLALAGGLSVLIGYHARLGGLLLAAFLVPVTISMHRFWGIEDAQGAEVQMAMFMKNLALTGGALLIAHFGAGPMSADARRERATA